LPVLTYLLAWLVFWRIWRFKVRWHHIGMVLDRIECTSLGQCTQWVHLWKYRTELHSCCCELMKTLSDYEFKVWRCVFQSGSGLGLQVQGNYDGFIEPAEACVVLLQLLTSDRNNVAGPTVWNSLPSGHARSGGFWGQLQTVSEDVFISAIQHIRGFFYENVLYKSTFDIDIEMMLSICRWQVHHCVKVLALSRLLQLYQSINGIALCRV